MLTVQDISFYLGSRVLYEGATLQIRPRDRIGLIGANGTGKTTLLKIINGDYTPDKGVIAKSNECTIGFLNQDLLSYESNDSILNVAMQAFERQLFLQAQIDKILHQMEVDYQDHLIDKLAAYQDEFQALDGYSIRSKTEEVLEGLGFSTEDLERPLQTFSGGWRMRVMLAKMLLAKPSVLMLDEPTNHLDMPSIQWLENYLQDYEGAVIIVSHDREFLERAVNITVEVSGGKLDVYAGNYSFFLEEKALRKEIQQNAFLNQQQKIKQAEQFINRFRAKASKARQVQSRVKMLDKIETIDEVEDDNAAMRFNFKFNQQPGKIICALEDVGKKFGDKLVLQDTTLNLERGDKVALIGANGKGKSTLLRIIAGTEPMTGKREVGYNVIPSFYAQHQLEALNIENEILQELKESGADKNELELRKVLGCFLFHDDDVFKKIKVLSGGEKSRVALAKTLISEANFLLLDEPTNHLDMRSVNILIQALQQFEGTYVIVSHDRHFVAHTANKIWYVEDHMIKEYPGTYDEYVVWQEQREELAKQQKQSPSANQAKKPTQASAPVPEDKSLKNRIKQAQRKVEDIENKIALLEKTKEELEAKLADPNVFKKPASLSETTQQYEKAKSDLVKANAEWEKAVVELEKAEKGK